MNPTLYTSPHELREALYVLSTEQDVPDAKLLDDVVRRYPEFGEELTEFAIAIAVDSLLGEHVLEDAEAAVDPSVVNPAVNRAMSYFQNRLHAVKTSIGTAKKPSTGAEFADTHNPFLSLPRKEFREFASRLNANAVFVSKLRDRQINPATMTQGFQKRVADELEVPLDVVVAHFAAHPATPSRQFFKTDTKPSIGVQQSFEDAVRSSCLNDAQQKFLLEL